MANVKITGIEETKKELIDQIGQRILEFSLDLLPIIRNRSNMGPSLGKDIGIKRGWTIISNSKSLENGLINDQPYVERQNIVKLRHIRGMENAKKWERSFGTEFGKERAAWAQRVHGTDTPTRRYWRGYRRAIEDGNFDTFAAKFVESSLKELKGRVTKKSDKGDETIYEIDFEGTV